MIFTAFQCGTERWLFGWGVVAPLALAFSFPVAAHADPLTAAEAVSKPSLCWSPAALAAKADEERVQKRAPGARVEPPRGNLAGYEPVQQHGVIRRVELPPGKKIVALTFDLCEQSNEIAGYQGSIIEFLRKNDIKATFFAGGKWLLTHPVRAHQLMADRRFEIANHSWEHRNLRLLSGPQLADEIVRAQLACEMLRGQLEQTYSPQCIAPDGGALAEREIPKQQSLFRFPFGACDGESLSAVGSLGLRAIQWDVAAGDPASSQTALMISRQVLAEVQPGSIVLFHANGRGWHTDAAVPSIVARLKEQGYEFATVSELLGAGTPVIATTCYDRRPGDTDYYDRLTREGSITIQKHDRRTHASARQLLSDNRRSKGAR